MVLDHGAGNRLALSFHARDHSLIQRHRRAGVGLDEKGVLPGLREHALTESNGVRDACNHDNET
jgi:hypothetical protein